jgi:hypothetical protein
MLPLPEVIILVLVPLAPLFSHRVWLHAQLWLPGAILVPGPRMVAPILRVMGLAMEQLCIMSGSGSKLTCWPSCSRRCTSSRVSRSAAK